MFCIYKSYDRQQPISATFKEAVLIIDKTSDAIYRLKSDRQKGECTTCKHRMGFGVMGA